VTVSGEVEGVSPGASLSYRIYRRPSP